MRVTCNRDLKFLDYSLDTIRSEIENRRQRSEISDLNRQKEIEENEKIYAKDEVDRIIERMICNGENVFSWPINHLSKGTLPKVIAILKDMKLQVRNNFPYPSITVATDFEL
jgi:hypothetical protein